MKFLLKLLIIIISFSPITVKSQLFENFEEGTKNSYAVGTVDLQTGEWIFDDALIGNTSGDKKNGAKSARIRDGNIEMNFDYPNGLLEVSFYAANFSADDGGAVQVSYSADGGATWIGLGDQVNLTSDLTQYSISESIEGSIRLRFEKSAGNRINIDDVMITDYIHSEEEPTLVMRINDVVYDNGDTFDFGRNTGEVSANLQIRNVGLEDLIISSHDIIGEEFSVEGDLNVTLANLEVASFVLQYSSETPGVKNGSLTIYSNDPENQEFTINLTSETLDTSQPIPINEARQLPQGTVVSVAGWVTVASQFAGPVYFQDETGGIAWYNNDIMREEWLVGAVIGDSITVTGELGNFYNLIQIVNDSHFEVFPESNIEIEPLEISIEQLNSGEYEAMLVQVYDIEFSDAGVFSGATNYTITDGTDEGQVRIDNYTNIPGTNIPNSDCQITGVAGRFQNTQQLLPRYRDDIKETSGPVILTAPPYEVSATNNSITFEWETQQPAHSEIRYGVTNSFELGNVIDNEFKTNHSLTITNLNPATAYKVQLRSAFDADTSATSIYISSTGSPEGSTGQILTFFNKDVAHVLATYREADENIDFSEKLIEYIQSAEETAEFAFYNLSGDVGTTIADEIIAAHNRGVEVRVIASGHTGNENPLITYLAESGVKAVQSLGTNQMHNKFAVFDAIHENPSKTWVVTSSWNATDEGTYNQYQNMVIVQDVALARAYWYEFNQMWGDESGAFNSTNARFGPFKSIVNPSVFWIGEDETKIEVYFSPQANTESHIIRNLLTAQASIDLALNLITRRTISNAMLSRFEEGVKVRGAIGLASGQGTEWDFLSTWADVHHFPQGEFGLLHHKYAIVDGEVTTSNSKVITGSHNWSANANFSNDENTLFIHNQRVANEYFQEFAARYWQAGGEDEFDVSVSAELIKPEAIEGNLLKQNYPNPFSISTSIFFSLINNQNVRITIYDLTGRSLVTLVNNKWYPKGLHEVTLNASNLSSGTYIYSLQLGNGAVLSKRMSILK